MLHATSCPRHKSFSLSRRKVKEQKKMEKDFITSDEDDDQADSGSSESGVVANANLLSTPCSAPGDKTNN